MDPVPSNIPPVNLNEPNIKRRSIAPAILSSLFCVALGYFYCGKAKRGIVIYAITTIFISLQLVLFNFVSSIYFLIFIIFTSLSATIFIIVDLVKIVRKNRVYQLKKYNKWSTYAGILFISFCINSFFGLFEPSAFNTPTGSMYNTVMIGDLFFSNNIIYGIQNPLKPGFIVRFSTPKTGDVVNFQFPGYRDEVKPNEEIFWLKRVLACPGDTLLIKQRDIYINSNIYKLPATARTHDQFILPEDHYDQYIFPKESGWNGDNYGPVIIPKEGQEITLDTGNIENWKIFIQREGAKEIETHGYQIFIDGKESYTYKVKRNYYFVTGDNWNNSLDSRYIGFIPEDYIEGKLTSIYFSYDPQVSGSIKGLPMIRWDRIGKKIE